MDTKNCLSNHMIGEHKQPGEVFKCGDCDFSTSRKTGLRIHKSKKHDAIEQLYGNDSYTEEAYAKFYWERDYMGTLYQTCLDVMENIKSAAISQDEKSSETERALEAIKEAFIEKGDSFEFIQKRMPPWSLGAGYQ